MENKEVLRNDIKDCFVDELVSAEDNTYKKTIDPGELERTLLKLLEAIE